MKSLLRRHLVLLMLGVTAAAFTVSIDAPAFAKDGRDNSGSGSSNSGSGGGGDDNSGSGGGSDDDDDGDDNSGSGPSGDSDDNDSNDDSNDDNSRDDNSNDDSARRDDNRGGNGGGNKVSRPTVQLTVDDATRKGLLNGTLVAVDNLGRPLEVEVEDRNGQTVVIAKPHGGDAKRNPGPISSYEIVSSANAPVHQ
jgi:hypothetical protein